LREVNRLMSGKVTYRQQFTRCGKQRCQKCRQGTGHGPYWYAYWSVNGRTVSKYLGKEAPEDIEIEIETRGLHKPRMFEVDTERLVSPPAPEHDMQRDIQVEASSPARISASSGIESSSDNQPVLRIYLLGQFRIESLHGNSWQTIASSMWQRRRARALLGCLLSNAGRRLSRELAMRDLWPDHDTLTAANRLNGAVHELRRILEPGLTRSAASRMLRLEHGVLQLAGADVIWVDAEAFERLLSSAQEVSDPVQAEHILEEAAQLYTGDYLLEELYAEWATTCRESLRRGWIDLLLNLAELRSSRGALLSAIEPLERLLATDPTHETAVRLMMLLLTRLDRRGEALNLYQRLVNYLQREYESDPLPETYELYEALRHGDVEVANPVASKPVSKLASPIACETLQQRPVLTDSEPQPHMGQAFIRPTLQLKRQNQNPLIGRDQELVAMREYLVVAEDTSLEEAHKGTSYECIPLVKHNTPDLQGRQMKTPFILLLGEAGIGKTRLAEEFSLEAYAQGWSVAWGRVHEQERATPFRPWIEALATLLQDTPLAFHMPTAQERLRLWEATLSLLTALSRETRILLVLDDLHWADESSLELLAYLVRHLQDEPILLVGTCREEELTVNSHLRTLINDLRREQRIDTLSLQPLTNSQIGSLVAPLPEELAYSIQTLAAGNPFIAEELARASETSPSALQGSTGEIECDSQFHVSCEVVPSDIHSDDTLSKTIAFILERRMSKLSNDCLTLLDKASALGDSFELNQLLLMGGDRGPKEDSMLDLLEEALRTGFLTEERTRTGIIYHFRVPFYARAGK
jgi:DNA-binding SARP family transcriptional activator